MADADQLIVDRVAELAGKHGVSEFKLHLRGYSRKNL